MRQKSVAARRELGAQTWSVSRVKLGAPEGFGASASETARPGSSPMARQVMARRSGKPAASPSGLSGCAPDRGKKDGIQAKRSPRSSRHCEMTQMGRVKTAAEESYAAAATFWLIHA